jgi:flagellin-specific chaperone FliS
MKTMAYTQTQNLTLDGERAFEELYTRLARWTQEAAEGQARGDRAVVDAKIERCVSLLGFMDREIDPSQNQEVANAILSLHRFAIGALIKAKIGAIAKPKDQTASMQLEALPRVFVSLADIFAAMRANKSSLAQAPLS